MAETVQVHEDFGFRTATEADIEAVARIKTDGFIDKATRFGSRDRAIKDGVKEMKDRTWVLPQLGLMFEKSSGLLVGACQVKLPHQEGEPSFPRWAQYICKEGEAHVEFICVGPGQRGKGVGKSLLQWSDKFARDNGCSRITLEVATNNRAQSLYLRQGYCVVKKSGCCDKVFIWCLLGIPGVFLMEKTLDQQ
uniref:N-acetyltransferase domain-containing protein n=1 Tax=Mucochytrium quahogii TaxID=96639 RepID=A0A7S2RXU2_9STRA|mmetsp:Transcript_634/g.1087  ORF Transcript_634/g.1087 Transcript_634/m.1087 type:complete len:193 (-) Transcript_634:277-855(-)|eukprot:CAMPEP_0203760594 /NCGR_PEP_ID=MMETSP0098-20131031/13856_1 /ASSEMBLY_ACC=CAM_ASM_000208 /TAXON_ID=96639 /ORGANISM=" , Strain NY0313808BC1" /LENGTH=192 /DNA_ID=CAMNT_0050654229 /DNA_START=76 /DNA_END=654 /DNA_ORIENTATION=+